MHIINEVYALTPLNYGYDLGYRFKCQPSHRASDGSLFPSSEYRSGFGLTEDEARENVHKITTEEFAHIESSEARLGC